MPGYAPLPSVELDPRTDSELVQAAAQRVYDASNATINDFSAGSPIMALLEGQVFAQGELLQFANQFPESVLVEWIGPFLGAQRRTGSGAIVDITFTIDPRDDQFDVFEGYQLATDANLTGGEAVEFVTTERLVIPPGQETGKVRAISVFRGASANVAKNTIIRSATSLAGVISVTNLEPATGGADAELMSEVKERFFSLIRRRNPVSAEDWVDFFSDALGSGAGVTVLPRRSEKDTYRYEENYIATNPSVAFFVLNPDGTPINSTQRDALQNLIKWSLPNEFLGYVYPMEVDNVDFVMDLEYDSNKPYAQDLTTFTETVRNNLFGVMTPNAVFPVSYPQSVTDVQGALTTTFPLTLGTTNQFIDPDVKGLKAYHPPTQLGLAEFTQTSPVPFETGFTIQKGDLLMVAGNYNILYYPALASFNPIVDSKMYYVQTGDLEIETLKAFVPGVYDSGDVVVTDTEALHVVLVPFTYEQRFTIDELIAKGYISNAKIYSDWTQQSFDPFSDGVYDPILIRYDQSDSNYNVGWPTLPAESQKNLRPGTPVFVVAKTFTVPPNTTSIITSQELGLVSEAPVEPTLLVKGTTYEVGTYVKTPDPTELQVQQLNTEFCYIDNLTGALEIFMLVKEGFTFPSTNSFNYTAQVNELIASGIVKVVQTIPFTDCKGTSTFAAKPFRYTARFNSGEYVRYRPKGGYDAGDLEVCLKLQEECASLTDGCKKLLRENIDAPSYYFVLKDFTPNTTDMAKLVEEELLEQVSIDIFSATYTAPISASIAPVYSATITAQLIAQGSIISEASLVPGQTCQVNNLKGDSRGLYEWNSSWVLLGEGLPTFRDIFRFAPGDVASFRSGSGTRNFEATQHVTPILNLEVYYDNGVFKTSEFSETVKYNDPEYQYENVIFSEVNSSDAFYRCTRSFTPTDTVEVWNKVVLDNTPRLQELQRNLLKFVNLATCEDAITARLRDNAATVKLGTCQLNITSKNLGSVQNTFVWETTGYAVEAPRLSYYPGTAYPYLPVDYGTGTLAL
jgi:hypothetical protein